MMLEVGPCPNNCEKCYYNRDRKVSDPVVFPPFHAEKIHQPEWCFNDINKVDEAGRLIITTDWYSDDTDKVIVIDSAGVCNG